MGQAAIAGRWKFPQAMLPGRKEKEIGKEREKGARKGKEKNKKEEKTGERKEGAE